MKPADERAHDGLSAVLGASQDSAAQSADVAGGAAWVRQTGRHPIQRVERVSDRRALGRGRSADALRRVAETGREPDRLAHTVVQHAAADVHPADRRVRDLNQAILDSRRVARVGGRDPTP